MGTQQMLLGGGIPDPTDINIYIPAKWGTNNATGATVSTYYTNATKNHYSGQKSNTFHETHFSRVGDGILSFQLPAATYQFEAKSGGGSGTYSWGGSKIDSATLTLSSATDILVLIPNHGLAAYAGGGGFFLIAGTDYTSAYNVPIFILGGGGGGYQYNNDWCKPGDLSANNLNSSRRGSSEGYGGNYDGGAGFLDTYTVKVHAGSNRAKHFVQGGSGGTFTGCASTGFGGFGGGGGSCPGGGGGVRGGYAGTDGHNNGPGNGGSQWWNGAHMGGGGGTSYYNTTYVSNIVNEDTGSTNSTHYSSINATHGGYFGIYTV